MPSTLRYRTLNTVWMRGNKTRRSGSRTAELAAVAALEEKRAAEVEEEVEASCIGDDSSC